MKINKFNCYSSLLYGLEFFVFFSIQNDEINKLDKDDLKWE